MENKIIVSYLAKQVCSECGKEFTLRYNSDGTYDYVDNACDCVAEFSPADGVPSFNEWLELMAEVLPDAYSGAKKLCKAGTCICHYDCGKEKNHLVKPPRPLTDLKVCPIAKYNVQKAPNEKPWYECHVSERNLNEDEAFALCACCEHADLGESEDGESWTITRKDLRLCCDCPVKMELDAMQELAAEARMS